MTDAKQTKQVVIELRVRIEVAAEADKDDAARQWLRACRSRPASYMMEFMRIVDVEVEDPYRLMADNDGWRYRDFTDEQ